MNSKKNILAVAVGTFLSGGLVAQEGGDEELGWLLEEIIVTANKREQSLQDIGMSVSVLSADDIEKKGLVTMKDYLSTLPGVTMQDRGAGHNTVVIRGIGSDPQREVPATGVYFGEVPLTGLYGASPISSSGSADIRLVDIERVEVLRGPQGTLYGAGSMGGTVRQIPSRPNLEEVEGKLVTAYSETTDTGGDNTRLEGVINVPLIEDKLAVRAVAYRFDDSGYVSGVAASQPTAAVTQVVDTYGVVARDKDELGANEATGFRVHALWQPTDDLRVDVMHLQQEVEQEGKTQVNLALAGGYGQARLDTGPDNRGDFDENEVEISNLVVTYDLGWAEVTNSAAWIDHESMGGFDYSSFIRFPLYGASALDNDVFINELRLVTTLESDLQFLVGAYYQDQESQRLTSNLFRGAETSGSIIDTTLEQKAVFGELYYSMTEQLMITAGVRHFDYTLGWIDQSSSRGTSVRPDFVDKDQLYKINLDYTMQDNTLVYASWSEGFRQGSPRPRPVRPDACDVNEDNIIDELGVAYPDAIESDTTENFELGFKTSLLDNRIALNAAIYRINWDGIPVSLSLACGRSVPFNAGKARTEGLELDAKMQVTADLLLDFSASYNDAVLTEDAANVGDKGDNLPGSADYNASIGLKYTFTLLARDAFVRADYSYVGEYYNNTAEEGESAGDYHQVNIRAGLSVTDHVNVDLFVRNLNNSDGFTWLDDQTDSAFGSVEGYRLRPRTIGLTASYHF